MFVSLLPGPAGAQGPSSLCAALQGAGQALWPGSAPLLPGSSMPWAVVPGACPAPESAGRCVTSCQESPSEELWSQTQGQAEQSQRTRQHGSSTDHVLLELFLMLKLSTVICCELQAENITKNRMLRRKNCQGTRVLPSFKQDSRGEKVNSRYRR